MNPAATRLASQALAKLKSTIWSMPVRYAGGGEYDILQYDRDEKSIVIDATLWRKLWLTGNWIQDATVLRWAELTGQINREHVKASTVIDCLLTVPNEERNIADARKFYTEWNEIFCVWTDRKLADRLRSRSRRAVLFLAQQRPVEPPAPPSSRANQKKREKLPTYDLLQQRRDSIIHCLHGLDDAFGKRFCNEAQSLMGSQSLVLSRWEIQLFSRFIEAFETTATQRGATR